MKIDPATRTLVLEKNTTACRSCRGGGTTVVHLPCPTNGRGPRGGKGGCRTCHGTGRHYDAAVRETCVRCNGIDPMHHDDDDLYDGVHLEVLAPLVEWRVVDATDTRFTGVGLCLPSRGSIMTVGDYGDHKRLTDDELVAKVSGDRGWTQWSQVTRKNDMRLCDAVVIVRRHNGYSVRPAWDDETADAVAA